MNFGCNMQKFYFVTNKIYFVFYLSVRVCLCVHVCLYVSVLLQIPEVGVGGSCEQSDMSTGNKTPGPKEEQQVLYPDESTIQWL